MTIILSVPSQSYTPRTINTNFNVPAGTKRVQATLTRESWPVGAVGSVQVNFPDGTLAAGVTFNGGVQLDFKGNVEPLSGVNFSSVPGSYLPTGSYEVVVGILQTLTTAVLVERF